MKLGEKIQKLRKEKGYSQEEFAKHIGIGRSTLANYEQGIRKPSYVMLELIAKALNTTPSYLMGWDDDSKEEIMDTKNELVIKEVNEITDKLKEYDHRTALAILEMVASLVKLSS